MGTGLSPQQKQLLEIVQSKTRTSMSDFTRVLNPSGYELAWSGRGNWAAPKTMQNSVLRSLYRLQERGLIKTYGFNSRGERRWMAT